jgi:hypothetical protein
VTRKLGVPVWIFLVAACQPAPRPSSGPGQLDVSWQGSSTGSLSGTATARWCNLDRVLEIQTVRGDTGLALALYPAKEVAPGAYPVVPPERAESAPPAAAIAARWPTKTLIQGFQGDSGQVTLQRSSKGRWSGRLQARARSAVDTQRIVLSGSFQDLRVERDSLGCLPRDTLGDDNAGDAGVPDTSVH